MSRVGVGTHLATFARSFSIQGSWNYRTMLGQGFGFAILPVLRRVHAGDPEELERALERHVDHFNAHPYLAELALGAVARMEADGEDPEAIRRFKTAVRGPLGGLGDRLVWVGGLPAASLLGLLAVLAGAPAWVPPVVFLVSYNLGHLTLRAWAYRAGVEHGAAVVERLRSANLARIADRLHWAGTFLAGGLLGMAAVTAGRGRVDVPRGITLAAIVVALVVGVRWGQSAWRRALVLTVVLVAAGLVAGALP